MSLEVPMQAARTVSGWVRDEGNATLMAYVTAVETTTGESHVALVDPTTGHYVLDTLPDGTYDLCVSDTVHCPAFFSGVSVSSTVPVRTLNATLLTTATTLAGRVMDVTGMPVACAEVAMRDASGVPLSIPSRKVMVPIGWSLFRKESGKLRSLCRVSCRYPVS